eukprot:TRINITY_DN7822_c2_g7_i2.p1 TRINITY_DN7822_c2_g7~~TRINITY_DN7822_c2_g7_i2.p1  ORF type:complete len:1046 (-),score=258.06 TRINITY_DN7822_c2_g7_i2:87-3224(-)
MKVAMLNLGRKTGEEGGRVETAVGLTAELVPEILEIQEVIGSAAAPGLYPQVLAVSPAAAHTAAKMTADTAGHMTADTAADTAADTVAETNETVKATEAATEAATATATTAAEAPITVSDAPMQWQWLEEEETLRAAIVEAQNAGLDQERIAAVEVLLKALQQKNARGGLSKVLAEGAERSEEILEDALKAAKEAELENDELVEAEKALEAEQRKTRAREACNRLCEPPGSSDLEALRAAISEAVDAGLSEVELLAIQEQLASEEKKDDARNRIQDSCKLSETGELSSDMLEKILAEGLEAGLTEDDLVTGRLAVIEARKREARKQLVEAIEAAEIGGLERALAHGAEVGLQSEDLEDGQKALAKAIQKHWRGILTAEPPEISLEAMLPSLGDILRMGFDKDFLEKFVLKRISTAEGMSALALAQCLEALRNEFEYFPGTLDQVQEEEVEDFFYKGLEEAAEREVTGIDASGREKAILWLDMTPSTLEAEAAAAALPSRPTSLPARLPVVSSRSSGEGSLYSLGSVSLAEATPSMLLCLELQSFSSGSAGPGSLEVSAFSGSGEVMWSLSRRGDREVYNDEGQLLASLCLNDLATGSSAGSRSSLPSGGSRRSGSSTSKRGVQSGGLCSYLFIDMARASKDVFAVHAGASHPEETARNSFMHVGELSEPTARDIFESLPKTESRGRRGSIEGSVGAALAHQAKQRLAYVTHQGSKLSAIITRSLSDRSGKWMLSRPMMEEEDLANCELSEFVQLRSRHARHQENSLTALHDPDLSGRFRCWEFYRSMLKGGLTKIRCMATGVLWSTGKAGAVEVSLGNGILKDLKALSEVATNFRDQPLAVSEGFLALGQKLGQASPGSSGLLLRLGRVPEMPVSSIRGFYGWEKTWLCVVDTRGALGLPPWLQSQNQHFEDRSENYEPPSKRLRRPLRPVEVQLRQAFLRGRLSTTPQAAPQNDVGPWILSARPPTAAAKLIDINDPRYVLWLPCLDGAADLLRKGLAARRSASMSMDGGALIVEETRKRPATDSAEGDALTKRQAWSGRSGSS